MVETKYGVARTVSAPWSLQIREVQVKSPQFFFSLT